MGDDKKPFYRLPKSVKPTHYSISIYPVLNHAEPYFSGTVEIHVEVLRETQRIRLNSLDLLITSASLKTENGTYTPNNVNLDADNEAVTFDFSENLPLGPGVLKIPFEGKLTDNMKGFYKSKYKNASGEEKYLAVTQFEPTDARRAFPCWDEPAVKATYDIELLAPVKAVALSNMNVLSDEPHETLEGVRRVKFARTPVMSTYLVAFVVGEFDFIEGRTDDGVLVKVFTPPGKREQGRFALDISLKTLPFYKEYFGIAYALPKLDLIAIPDFAAGAMENWGLVTYRETALLIDQAESSASAKQRVALVVGHELAHQWFGNLTTMEWWTHLWLNEGFASWIEYLCVNHCCPDYDIWTQFIVEDYVGALELDSLRNSHPIEVPVGHPSEIDEIFDAISYSKGASVIRMLHNYIGDDAFRKGLNHYLNEFQYKNAVTEDLWHSLDLASGKPVGRIMSTWTSQMGFPVIDVSSQHAGSQLILKISQKKFSADGSQRPEDAAYRWLVPICVATSKDPEKPIVSTLLSDPDMVLFLDDAAQISWVKINPGHVGFYRTRYSEQMLEEFIPALKKLKIPPRDRLGIQNDVFALAVAGLLSTVDYFNILEGYAREDCYAVWNDIEVNLKSLSVIMQYTDVFDRFTKFLISVFKPIGEVVGWESKPGEGHLMALLRSLVLGRLGRLGDPSTVEECQKRFAEHVNGGEKIPADLRSAVYWTVIAHGDVRTLEQLIVVYKGTTHMEEKVRLLQCMGGSTDPEVIKKVLEFSLSNEVKYQDFFYCLIGCTSSAVGRELTWTFVKEKWEEINKRYEGGFLLNRIVSSVTENFASEEKALEVQAFFSNHPVPSAERTVKQSVESIRLHATWLQRDKEKIRGWLRKMEEFQMDLKVPKKQRVLLES